MRHKNIRSILRNMARKPKQTLSDYMTRRVVDRHMMRYPPYNPSLRASAALWQSDHVRNEAILSAIATLDREGVRGAFAELGVYRGETSRVIHQAAPDRTLYLFDTFTGFPASDLQGNADQRFSDTSVTTVEQNIGDLRNIVIRRGYFPETAAGLEDERFAFVMLDMDLYGPTKAAIEFFYPRVVRGGYLFAHDYNSPEFDEGVSRALDSFFADKTEFLVELPDVWGSVLVRKV